MPRHEPAFQASVIYGHEYVEISAPWFSAGRFGRIDVVSSSLMLKP